VRIIKFGHKNQDKPDGIHAIRVIGQQIAKGMLVNAGRAQLFT